MLCRRDGEERRPVREGLRRMGMDGGDVRGVLRCLKSSGGREDVFRFLADTGVLQRP